MNYLVLLGAMAVSYMLFGTFPLIPNEKSFTLYYWSNCGYCKTMMPDYNSLGSYYKGIRIRKIEKSFNFEYPVSGFPTMIYRDGNGVTEKYDGGRDRQSIMLFLQAKV
jgi:hypothetical protein